MFDNDNEIDFPVTPIPAFIWPEDRTWCVANDVDPPWAGIGASRDAIRELMNEPRLNLAFADPSTHAPNL